MQWLAVLLPALALGLFEFLRHTWLDPILPGELGNLVGAGVVAGGVYIFVRLFTGVIRRTALEAARARAEAAVMAERQRIARDVHDHVAQALFYLSVKVREQAGLLAAGDYGRARDELLQMEGHLNDAYRQVRSVITDLKQQAAQESFAQMLRHAARQAGERLGLQVAVDIEGDPVLADAARQHVLAIMQEALTNAERHGRARRARVRMAPTDAGWRLEVADDGTGFDPDTLRPEGSFGLTIMAERARILGGELDVSAAPGQGTQVIVQIPEVSG